MGEPGADSVSITRSGQVATVRIAGAAGRGTLDADTKTRLREGLERMAADPQVRAVVLTGKGATFCAGQDLHEHATMLERDATAAWDTLRDDYQPIVQTIATMPKPVIAAINGMTAGAGVSLALACDLRLVADTAVLHLAFPGIGLSLDSGLSWTLPRLVGYGRALDLALRPRPIAAATALDLGLATDVVPARELAERAAGLATRLAEGPTVAFGAIKRVMAYSAAHSLAEALDVEAAVQTVVGVTDDHVAAVRAFLAKRAPRFEGH